MANKAVIMEVTALLFESVGTPGGSIPLFATIPVFIILCPSVVCAFFFGRAFLFTMFENIILSNILSMLDTQVYSLSQAEKIVGGRKHLQMLVLGGKVSEKVKKGRLYYNAREIALHAKNYR